MNEPIISPWIFYLLGILKPLETLFGVMTICALGVAAFVAICGNDEQIENIPSKIKKSLILAAIAFIMAILIPTPSTVVKMIIASKVTPANLQMVKDESTDIADKVFSRIEGSTINIIKEIKK